MSHFPILFFRGRPSIDSFVSRGGLSAEFFISLLESFELALQIDPENPAANSGQRRALVLDDVLALYINGTNAEQEGNLEAALNLFQQALNMDSDFENAAIAAQSVEEKINARSYRNSISTGLLSIENGDLAVAKEAFESALMFRPGSQEALSGLSQTEILIERQSIGSNLVLAIEAHEQEKWEEASLLYGKILFIDPTVKQAIQRKKIVDHMMGVESEPNRKLS